MSELSLEEVLVKFLNMNDKGMQLDLFRDDEGSLVIQLFKGSDVKKWSYNFEVKNDSDIIFNIFFNKNKKNNYENYERLINSDWDNDFIFFDRKDQGVHLACYNFALNSQKLHEKIERIVYDLYNISLNQVNFRLGVFN